jgi:hypothetical protein
MKLRPVRSDSPLNAVAHLWGDTRPIVLVARNSGENGSDARRQAVNDLLDAAEWLAAAGCDIRPDLPSKAALLELIRCAVPIRSKDKTGKGFSNRIAAIDLRAAHGVYVVLSVGTGRKLDEKGTQPFVQYLAEVVAQVTPCLLFARRLDRVTRRAWALGAVMLNLTELSAFIGDAEFGICSADGIESVLVFFRAQAGEEEARKLPVKTRNGMSRETGRSMASGSCAYAVAAPVPPGFMSYRSTVRGMIGRRVMTFDTPSCRPAAESVAAGLPEVFECRDDGTKVAVNQVANVRWALERLGEPTWSVPAIAKGLAARMFSTEGLRRTHGPEAVYTMEYAAQDAYKVLYSIKANLDLYETGVMTLGLGVEGVEPVVITDCFPPDGLAWASPADFERIRHWMINTMPPARRSSVLTGLPVCVNGIDCVLIRPGGSRDDVPLTAVVAADYRKSGRQLSPGAPIVIRPEMIIEPFVEAIANLGDAALVLVPFEADHDGVIDLELDSARTRLRVLGDERAAIEAQLLVRGDDGRSLQVSGALLARLNERYNAIADVEEPSTRQAIRALEEQREARRHQALRERAGIAAERMLALIAALRDPYDTTNRELLHRTIRDLRLTADRLQSHRRAWWEYTITYTIRLEAGDGTLDVPVIHSAVHGTPFDAEALARASLTEMCSRQVTWRNARALADPVVRRELAKVLDIPSRTLVLPNVTDERLAHLAARVLSNAEDIASIAADTGETEALLERIRHVHRNAPRAVWRVRPRATIASWYRLAALGPVTKDAIEAAETGTWESARNMLYDSAEHHHWTWTESGYVLDPCPLCGGRRRSPALIPEPVGLVCLDCETDEVGERWPLATYGRYLAAGEPPGSATDRDLSTGSEQAEASAAFAVAVVETVHERMLKAQQL